jgi:hypothetical protein
MYVESVLDTCAFEMADKDYETHSKADVLMAFNRAMKAIVSVRPDENVQVDSVTCVAGATQQVPSNALRLIRVLGFRERTSEEMFRDDPNWQYAGSTGEFEFWIFDERSQKRFELYPNAEGGETVKIEVALPPDEIAIADIASFEMPVSEIYLNPAINYMKYILFSADPTNAVAMSKSREAISMFSNELELKWRIDQMFAEPKEKGSANG